MIPDEKEDKLGESSGLGWSCDRKTPVCEKRVQGDIDTPPAYTTFPVGLYPGVPTDILRSMALHSDSLRSTEMSRSLPTTSSSASSSSSSSSAGPSSTYSSRRSSTYADDVEPGHSSNWAAGLMKGRKRKTRKVSLIAGSVIMGCGMFYMLMDNFLLADWVSANARYPESLGSFETDMKDIGQQMGLIPDDQALKNGNGSISGTLSWASSSTWMSPGVLQIVADPTHVLVPVPHTLAPATPLLQPLRRLSSDIMIPYYVNGSFPSYSERPIPAPQMNLDIVYTFVNSSSRVLLAAKDARAHEEGLSHLIGAQRHWRDNGELRGAVRSVVQSLGEGLRKVHLVAADFRLSETRSESESALGDGPASHTRKYGSNTGVASGGGNTLTNLRRKRQQEDDDFDFDYEFMDLNDYSDDDSAVHDTATHSASYTVGQIPSWLDPTSPFGKIQFHFHSEIFRLPSDNGTLPAKLARDWISEDRWKAGAQPSFNSFEIESRVGWIQGLSDNFILSNDDMFFLRGLSTADFHHPLLGPIIRLAPDRGLRVKPYLSAELLNTSGEWGGLQHANLLLSNRFYKKERMYMSHVPKSMSRALTHEASIMFAPQLAIAATRGFRESSRGRADVHFAWLVSHLLIERWREALLWSWAVARVGGADGVWGEAARTEIWTLLGLPNEGRVEVPRNVIITGLRRDTIRDMEDMMEENDWPFPEGSDYRFTSMDGHLPNDLGERDANPSCIFTIPHCLPVDFFTTTNPFSATTMFKHLAYIEPDCGDCIIKALVNASGSRGMSAILPNADQIFTPTSRPSATASPDGDGQEAEEETRDDQRMWVRGEPMLPLTGTWSEGKFGLGDVVHLGQDRWEGETAPDSETVNLRAFCIKLLSRYVYSLAISPTHFALMRNVGDLINVLSYVDNHPDLALACLNDDQPDTTDYYTAQILGDWMSERWGDVPATWERQKMRDWVTKNGRGGVVDTAAKEFEGQLRGFAEAFKGFESVAAGGSTAKESLKLRLAGPGQGRTPPLRTAE